MKAFLSFENHVLSTGISDWELKPDWHFCVFFSSCFLGEKNIILHSGFNVISWKILQARELNQYIQTQRACVRLQTLWDVWRCGVKFTSTPTDVWRWIVKRPLEFKNGDSIHIFLEKDLITFCFPQRFRLYHELVESSLLPAASARARAATRRLSASLRLARALLPGSQKQSPDLPLSCWVYK